MQESHQAFNRVKKHPTNKNLTEFKRKSANFRRIIKKNKKRSWRNYISSINSQTPTSAVWKQIKCMNGSKSSTNIQFLEFDDGRIVTQAHDIAVTLAKKFHENSNNINSLQPSIIYRNIHHDLIHNDNK